MQEDRVELKGDTKLRSTMGSIDRNGIKPTKPTTKPQTQMCMLANTHTHTHTLHSSFFSQSLAWFVENQHLNVTENITMSAANLYLAVNGIMNKVCMCSKLSVTS